MRTSLFLLLTWVEESFDPRILVNETLTEHNIQSLREEGIIKIKNFRWKFFEQVVVSNVDAAKTLKDLVHISNKIHYYLYHDLAGYEKENNLYLLKKLYQDMLGAIEQTLTEMSKYAGDYYCTVPISRHAKPPVLKQLKQQYQAFVLQLHATDIDPLLRDLILLGASTLIENAELSPREIRFCENLIDSILKRENNHPSGLLTFLYSIGFNLPDFYIFCISRIKRLQQEIPGLHEQLEAIYIEREQLSCCPHQKSSKLITTMPHIIDQLLAFLDEKISHLKALLKVRRAVLNDAKQVNSTMRLKTRLSVSQLAFLIKLLKEGGILDKDNIGEHFNFFATHFYTENTMFISADSLRKKSTDVEFATSQKLKAMLINMLNWVNEHYNSSNYRT
jgi:hypothetical protein